MKIQLFLAPAMLALALPIAAQPDPDNAPKGDNPTNRPVRPNRREMTPEQMREWAQNRFKRELTRAGITDQKTQNAVAIYAYDESQALNELQIKGRALQQALNTKTATETQIAGLLNDYNAALEEDKARRKKAQEELAKTFDITKNPRVEALLTLRGYWGDGPALGGGNRFATAQINGMNVPFFDLEETPGLGDLFGGGGMPGNFGGFGAPRGFGGFGNFPNFAPNFEGFGNLPNLAVPRTPLRNLPVQPRQTAPATNDATQI